MGRLTPLLLWLTGWGCGQAPEAVLSGPVGGCADHPGGARDWCVVQALSEVEADTIALEDRLGWCRALSDPDARDACLEATVSADGRAPSEVCDSIEMPRLRASCRLSIADRAAAEAPSMAAAADACGLAGPLREHCLVHVVIAHQDPWIQAGFAVYMEEVGLLLSESPGIAGMRSLGQAVGRVGAGLEAPLVDGPCDYFPDGPGFVACRERLAGKGPPEEGGP